MAPKKVVIYTTQYCPYCRAAKDLLTSQGVRFEDIDVTNSPELREKLVRMCQGRTTVPVILVDEKCLGGYEDLVRFYESGKTLK